MEIIKGYKVELDVNNKQRTLAEHLQTYRDMKMRQMRDIGGISNEIC